LRRARLVRTTPGKQPSCTRLVPRFLATNPNISTRVTSPVSPSPLNVSTTTALSPTFQNILHFSVFVLFGPLLVVFFFFIPCLCVGRLAPRSPARFSSKFSSCPSSVESPTFSLYTSVKWFGITPDFSFTTLCEFPVSAPSPSDRAAPLAFVY